MNLQTAIAQEHSKSEDRKRRSARLRAAAESSNGNLAHPPITASRWFDAKFPHLSELHGDAVLEEMDRNGIVSIAGINEDFFAATLGEHGSPHSPTVFVPTESRFYKFSISDGVFIHIRDAVLLAELSKELLTCSRAVKSDTCDTKALEFRLRDFKRLASVISKAKGHLEVDPRFFASSPTEFIACGNGMLRLSDRGLLPFAPAYRRRNKLAVRFDPSAGCPMFLAFLAQALEAEDIDLLQRWCGLALIGENLAQKMLLLIGSAGTGKTCFIKILKGIIGEENLALLRPHLLCERFEVSRYLGKTLLYGPDVSGDFLNHKGASVLKSLTGADPMTLEFKNSNETPSVIGNYNVIVTCNSRLIVRLEGDTDAWGRRLVIIKYEKPKPEKVITNLDQQILKNEAPGVLNWMVEGLAKLRADRWQLYLHSAQQTRVDDLLLESDGHTLFVKSELVKSEGAQLTVQECFAAYAEYCNERGWTTLTRNKFGQLVGDVVTRQHGLTVRHDIRDDTGKSQRGWCGLKLRVESRN